MTEDQIERRVEKATDAIDAAYMAGTMTEDEYKAALARLDKWANAKYATAARHS